MLTSLCKRITYTNLALTLALVFAMTGGAFAAGKFLITSTKQISPKVLASLKGAKGKNGTPGPAGAPGPQGPQGAAGAAGPKGNEGAAGKEGPQGKEGKEGEEGPQGPSGPSCNASGECLLPNGATETGVWSYEEPASTAPGNNYPIVSVSFPLRLTSAPTFLWVGPAESETPGAVSGCPGTVTKPEAQAGNLCVYAKKLTNTSEFPPETQPYVTDATSGVTFWFEATEGRPEMTGFGTWAVKG
jgi:hypothetical protein